MERLYQKKPPTTRTFKFRFWGSWTRYPYLSIRLPKYKNSSLEEVVEVIDGSLESLYQAESVKIKKLHFKLKFGGLGP